MLRRRRSALVLAIGGVLVLLALVDLAFAQQWWSVGLSWAAAALALVGLLHPDDRRRGAAAAAAAVVSWAGTAVLVAASAGTFSLVQTATLLLLVVPRWRCAATAADWVLAGAVAVAAVAVPLGAGGSDGATLAVLVVAAVAVAVAVAVVLRGQDAQHRTLVSAVRRAEREEVARELHDVVAHHVTGIIVATQAARTVVGTDPAAASAPVASALESIEVAGSEALGSMRRLVEVLRAGPAAGAGSAAPRLPTPVLADLDDLVQRFRRAGAVGAVELAVPRSGADVGPDAGQHLPAEVQAAVYRVVQESLTNVQRHAPGAALVRVDVVRAAGEVTVGVADSGAARTADRTADRRDPVGSPAGGFGLLGMRERVEALGGTLGAGPREGAGWLVTAVIPLPGGGRDG